MVGSLRKPKWVPARIDKRGVLSAGVEFKHRHKHKHKHPVQAFREFQTTQRQMLSKTVLTVGLGRMWQCAWRPMPMYSSRAAMASFPLGPVQSKVAITSCIDGDQRPDHKLT